MFSFFAALTTLITSLFDLLLTPSFTLIWRFKRSVKNFKLWYHFYCPTINTQKNEEWSPLLANCCNFNIYDMVQIGSNWLNIDDSFYFELFYDDHLHPIRKGNALLAKEIINRYYHSKYTVKCSKKDSHRETTSFSWKNGEFSPFSWNFLVTPFFHLILESLLPSLFYNPITISFHWKLLLHKSSDFHPIFIRFSSSVQKSNVASP